MIDAVSLTLAGLTAAGVVQSGAGWLAFREFARRSPATPTARPPVTILKPLHGNEPVLEEALASFCDQDYPDFQIVFGLQSAGDPALHVLRRLRARFPLLDMDVVVDPTTHGSNRKIANLINMLPRARHDVLVIADSDIHAAPSYLANLVAGLEQPGVGLVTTLYSGRTASNTLAGRLGAAHINHAFLPGALLARALGRQDCLGATMALTRATLELVGGLHALSNHLADDAELGRLVRAKGLSVPLASTVPATTVPETDLPALFQHELRWARTVRSLVPAGFALSVMQFPLFWATLALGVSGGAAWAWLAFAAAWLVRGAAARSMDHALKIASPLTIWCLPFRDLLSVTVILASYCSNRVAWRGQVHRTTRASLSPKRLSQKGLPPKGLSPTSLTPGKG